MEGDNERLTLRGVVCYKTCRFDRWCDYIHRKMYLQLSMSGNCFDSVRKEVGHDSRKLDRKAIDKYGWNKRWTCRGHFRERVHSFLHSTTMSICSSLGAADSGLGLSPRADCFPMVGGAIEYP